jgi:hypothetical protein
MKTNLNLQPIFLSVLLKVKNISEKVVEKTISLKSAVCEIM